MPGKSIFSRTFLFISFLIVFGISGLAQTPPGSGKMAGYPEPRYPQPRLDGQKSTGGPAINLWTRVPVNQQSVGMGDLNHLLKFSWCVAGNLDSVHSRIDQLLGQFPRGTHTHGLDRSRIDGNP